MVKGADDGRTSGTDKTQLIRVDGERESKKKHQQFKQVMANAGDTATVESILNVGGAFYLKAQTHCIEM